MTNQEKEIKYLEIMGSEEAVAELTKIKTPEDAQKVFVKYGLAVSVEEADDIIGSMVALAGASEPQEVELSEEELAGVSGGLNLKKVAEGAWDIGHAVAGALYYGSAETSKRATKSFWGNVVTRGWNHAVKNVNNY